MVYDGAAMQVSEATRDSPSLLGPIDRSDRLAAAVSRFSEETDFKNGTRRGCWRRATDAGTKFEISSGRLPRAAKFSLTPRRTKKPRLPGEKCHDEKSRENVSNQRVAGQSRLHTPRATLSTSFPRFLRASRRSTDPAAPIAIALE